METKQRASLSAVALAAVLAACKFVVGFGSGSMAVMSSGLDSMLDAFMSFMNFLAIKKADAPPDYNHHYGHGKIEDLAAIAQSLVVMFTGGMIVYSAVRKFLEREIIRYSGWDAGVMIVSLIFSFFISRVLKDIGEKTGSSALKADALHYSSDLYSNSGALVSIIITYYTGMQLFDLSFAVIIGIFITISAAGIFKTGIYGLTDTSVSDETKAMIDEIIEKKPPPYAGYHKLRNRTAGSKKYADFHLLICRKIGINDAHDMTEAVEREIVEKIKNIDVVIHMEPCPYTCEMTDETCRVLKMRMKRRLEGGGLIDSERREKSCNV